MSGASVTCESVRERLSAYVDDELPVAALADVRVHLGDCPDCRAAKEALAQVDAVTEAALGDHPFDDHAVEAVLRALPREAMATRGDAGRPSLPLQLAAAAALLLVGIGLALGVDVGGTEAPARQPLQPIVARAGQGLMILDGRTGRRSPGNVVRAGDQVIALETPSALLLEDGTRIDLHADTTLALRPDRDGGLAAVFADGQEGKVLCEVAPRRSPLRIVTRELEAEVLGTRFVVEQVRTGARVTVIEGRVRVSGAAERRVVAAGREAFVGGDGGRVQVTAVVAPRRAALWVPRVAEEHRLLEPPPRPEPVRPERPARPDPSTAPAVRPDGSPDLDVPVTPPTVDGADGQD